MSTPPASSSSRPGTTVASRPAPASDSARSRRCRAVAAVVGGMTLAATSPSTLARAEGHPREAVPTSREPAADWVPPPEPELRGPRRSEGAFVGGAVVAGTGLALVATGTTLLVAAPGMETGGSPNYFEGLGVLGLALGGGLVAVGAPIMIWGGRRDRSTSAFEARPSIALTPSSARATWTF